MHGRCLGGRRRIGFRTGKGFTNRRHQIGTKFRAGKPARHAAQTVQSFSIRWDLDGDLVDRVVFQDPAPRLIAQLGRAFTPGGHTLEHSHVFWRMFTGLEPPPGIFRRDIIIGRLDQGRHLGLDPGQAPSLLKLLTQHWEKGRQVGHIAKGIDQLSFREWPTRPIGKPARFIDLDPQHLSHQGVVSDLLTKASRHTGHLGVEQSRGHSAKIIEDLHVLTGGVEHDQGRRIAQDFQKRGQVDSGCQGIYDRVG